MHGFHDSETPALAAPESGPWYKSLNRYHWFVLGVAALGWLFDCLDQQLFILARPSAMKDLLKGSTDPALLKDAVTFYGDIATSVFIAGWATGGLIFGMLGDRIGRAKTMMITILIYSICTGLSALSQSVYDFAFYRFLTGLGVGGEFAVGVALVAEVMPAIARPQALATLQALSAVGNVSAALINMGLGVAEGQGLVQSPWRIMFMIGALPALLALFIRSRLKEPDSWVAAQASNNAGIKQKLGSYGELFSDPTLRKHALLGLVLACSGVIGLWAIGFYAPDLIRRVQEKPLTAAAYAEAIAVATPADKELLISVRDAAVGAELSEAQLEQKALVTRVAEGRMKMYQSWTSIATNIGAFFGMFGFGVISQRIGRKPTFVIALLAAFCSTVLAFLFMTDLWQIFVLGPIMGFCQLSLFAGYAMYFPELFPTRLRSTGTSFCYNVGRFVAAAGPLAKVFINSLFPADMDPILKLRYGGVAMCGVFLVGLLALPFLPETKGKPLPE